MAKVNNINDINVDFIIDYCKENGGVEWLKKAANEKIQNKDGKEIKKPFLTLRNEFCAKFMPELLSKKAKKLSMLDKINALWHWSIIGKAEKLPPKNYSAFFIPFQEPQKRLNLKSFSFRGYFIIQLLFDGSTANYSALRA